MTYTYDPTTSIGQCRLMVPDRVQASAVFSDEEYTAFLTLEGDPRRATAMALETIAANHALLFKVMRTSSLSFDGAAVARVLLQRAVALREQANVADIENGTAWDIAEQITGPFSYRERLTDAALRQG